MTVEQIIDVFREGISVAIRLSAPVLIMCMIVGVIIAILQAVTQIHEQSISFVLKLIVVVLFLTLGGSWMITSLQDFARGLFELII